MEPIVIRVKAGLKDLVKEISERQNRSLSEVTRDLIKCGIGAQKAGGLEIRGPFGGRRPLAELHFEGEEKNLSVRLDKKLIRKAERCFGKNTRKAVRRSIRLGSFLIKRNEVRITGIFELPRPFTKAEASSIEDEEAKNALKRLREK